MRYDHFAAWTSAVLTIGVLLGRKTELPLCVPIGMLIGYTIVIVGRHMRDRAKT